jgi:putative glycerol kinase 5
MVGPRLHWVQKNNKSFRKSQKLGEANFGTIETWLLKKLNLGNEMVDFDNVDDDFVTDISNASAAGFFDPYDQKYAWWASLVFPIKVMEY